MLIKLKEEHHPTKMIRLTEEQIEEIQKRRNKGESTYSLAKEFKVAQSTICYHTDFIKKEVPKHNSRKEYLQNYQKEHRKVKDESKTNK